MDISTRALGPHEIADDRRAHWRVLRPVGAVDLVHRGEVVDVLDVDVHAATLGDAGTTSAASGSVIEHAFGLNP